MAKNLNKVRTIHPISRVVEFEDNRQAAKFINTYKNLFYKAKGSCREEFGFKVDHLGATCTTVYFTIKKSDWEQIEKELDLELYNPKYYRKNYFICKNI